MDESRSVRFLFRGRIEAVSDFDPQLTVLEWLRTRAGRTGTKEGCAEGDCGACTVVVGKPDEAGSGIRYRSVNACIRLLATLDGCQLITVEDLKDENGGLHPVQQALVDRHGSQCGFCTPGFVMSLFALFHQPGGTDRQSIEEGLAGNLCRCTGYAPILAAAADVLNGPREDRFSAAEAETARLLRDLRPDRCLHIEHDGRAFHAPVSLAELCDLLAGRPDATLLAGATDVGLWITKQMNVMPVLIYTGNVPELRAIRTDRDRSAIEIGAAVTYTEALDVLAEHCPDLRPLLVRIGAAQVRNVGTIGGNIANGSPIGDMAPPLFVLGARLVLRSSRGRREIDIRDFYLEYGRQDLQRGEFLEKIFVPLPADDQLFRSYKLSKRFEQDISSVSASFLLRLENGIAETVRIAYGGMAGVPKHASRCEQALQGRAWSAESVDQAVAALRDDFDPISDWRASAAYRMNAAQNLLRRFFLETMAGEGYCLDQRSAVPFRPAPVPDSMHRAGSAYVHNSLAHDSAVKHVTGEAVFVDDILEPGGLLHLYFGTSDCAHGRIRRMDLSAVAASPGVVAVLTAADIPGLNDLSPMHAHDEEILCSGEIHYRGQVLFAVAAEDRERARRAARLAVIEVDELLAVTSIDQAMERKDWVAEPRELRRGDARAAIAAAEHRLSGELNTGGQEHFYLEGHVAMAVPREDGDLLIQSSSQNPTEIQLLAAQALGGLANAVTVKVRRMGGAFGGKETQSAQWAIIAALAARKTGRPAKIRLDRDDDMISTGKRHEFRIRYEVGFTGDGRIEGVVMDQAARCGISADLSGPIADRAMFHADNGYYLPAALIRSWRCRSNTVSNTALRGFGGPQGMMAIERVIDAIAAYLGKDPLEVRRLNLYGKDERNTTPYGMVIEDNVLPELLDELAGRSDYAARRAALEAFNQGSAVIKRGIALTPVKFGISFTTEFLNQAGAVVHVYKDGSIHLNHGGTEMGQGLFIKVAAVVADAFGVDIGKVNVSATHTGKVPNTSPTAASSGSDMNGQAALDAVNRIKQRLIDFAAGKYGIEPEGVVFEAGGVRIGAEEKAFADFIMEAYLARIPLSSTGFYRTPKIHFDWEKASGRPFYYFAYGAAVSEVEVDTLTGEHRMRRVDILHDVGRSLNPAIDRGQIEGGFIQGAGWLTSEELWWDEAGALRTHSPSTYKIPTGGDVPDVFNVDIWEHGCNREPTVYRSKAVGEPPLMLAISVHSAIAQAVAAADPEGRLPELDAPATPERVLMSIRGK